MPVALFRLVKFAVSSAYDVIGSLGFEDNDTAFNNITHTREEGGAQVACMCTCTDNARHEHHLWGCHIRDAPRQSCRQADTCKAHKHPPCGRRCKGCSRHALMLAPCSCVNSHAISLLEPVGDAQAAAMHAAAQAQPTGIPASQQQQEWQQQQQQQQRRHDDQQQEQQQQHKRRHHHDWQRLRRHERRQQHQLASMSDACAAEWVLPQYGGREVLFDFAFGMQLGRGSFGVTTLVTHRKTACHFACKTITKSGVPSRRALQAMQDEVAALQHMAGCPGVVQLAGVYEDRRSVHLVVQLCSGGELLQDLRCRGRYCEAEAVALARSMLTAIAACHAAGVMHRDIKPENFLFQAPPCGDLGGPEAPQLVLADFGAATFFREGELFSEVVGTAAYVAPEVVRGAYGKECDVWAAGVVLFLLLSGKLPFEGRSARQVMHAVVQEQLCLCGSEWGGVSLAAKAFVRLMLCKDPQRRPSAQGLLLHPWLQQRQQSTQPGRPQQQCKQQ